MGTVRDWLDLFRAGNCVSGLVGVFLGAILTLEEFPSGDNLKITTLLGLSVYSFMASWNALNDYLDLEIDKINRPDRPLPSERISQSLAKAAIIFTCLISLISLFLAGQIANTMTDNFADWYPTIAIWLLALGLLINYEDDRILLGLKNKGLPGNLAISVSVGLVVLFGAAGLFDPFNERAVSLFVIGPLYNLSREIITNYNKMEKTNIILRKSIQHVLESNETVTLEKSKHKRHLHHFEPFDIKKKNYDKLKGMHKKEIIKSLGLSKMIFILMYGCIACQGEQLYLEKIIFIYFLLIIT